MGGVNSVVVPYPRKKFTRMYVTTEFYGGGLTIIEVSPLLRLEIGKFRFCKYDTSQGEGGSWGVKLDTSSSPIRISSETENSFTIHCGSFSYSDGFIYLC